MIAISILLTVAGGLVSGLGLWLTVRQVARQEWTAQEQLRELDLVNMWEVASTDDPAALMRQEQRATRHLLRTGKQMGQDEPNRTLSEFRRQAFGTPVAITLMGIAVSTIGSLFGSVAAMATGS